MGKKKGKKGGGKGKKGGKKKETQMTAKEAILAYQVGVIEKKIEDVMYETRGWEEKNKKLEDRNEQLLEEQNVLIKHLLQQARKADQFFSEEEVKGRDDVIVALKDMWQKQRAEDKSVEDLKKKIAETEEEIARIQKEVDYCKDYRDKGQHENKKRINLLEDDLVDLDNSFAEMKTHLERTDEKAKAEISGYTDQMLHKQKDIATTKAISQLDKYSKREVIDNEWLRREVDIHQKDTDVLRKKVEEMESKNLEIMAELFECKIEDLKISRNFFLTQFDDNENLEESGILEMDLAKLSINAGNTDKQMVLYDSGDGDVEAKAVYKPVVRPKSATQKAVEDKVFSLAKTMHVDSDEESDESTETDLLDNMYFEEEDWNDYLKLGKLELKLLNVTGQQMPIHVPQQPTQAEIDAKHCNPDEWPVTQPMLQKATKA